jgi:hypothetical protein
METFEIIPATGKHAYFLVPVMILMLAVSLGVPVVLGSVWYAARSAHFEVSNQGLRLHGEVLWRKWIAAEQLRGRAARVVDLHAEPALQPRRRTAGSALPGYLGGWFRLQNGRKALIYVTDRRRVVHVPTTEGFDLLLSVQRPERMVERLQAIAPRE